MNLPFSRLMISAVLAASAPLSVSAEDSQSLVPEFSSSTRVLKVDMRGKPPYKRRWVSESTVEDPLIAVNPDSRQGRVGPPGRSPRTHDSEQNGSAVATEYADFARFEEVEDGLQAKAPKSTRRYLGAPGKHRRKPLDDN